MSFRHRIGPSAVLFALFSVAAFPSVAGAQTPVPSAQNPSLPAPQAAPASSIPVAPVAVPAADLPAAPTATPAPASSLPSLPAGSAPQTQAPIQAFPSAVPQQTPSATYIDPLQQPIVVAPNAPSVPPVRAVAIPQSTTASSLPSVGAVRFSCQRQSAQCRRMSWVLPYIPVDSWIYAAALRLYSLGYLNSSFITMRPWTRRSLLHAASSLTA